MLVTNESLTKNETLDQAVSNTKPTSRTETVVPVTVLNDQSAVVLNADTMAIVDKMYTSQDDISNEAKYVRTFVHGAVLAYAKQECRRLQGVWKNAITKVSDLHPTWSREQAEEELLQSKKMREFKAQVDVAVSMLKDGFRD